MILVVGAHGFLGRRVVRALADAGMECLSASHSGLADLQIDLSLPVESLVLPGTVTHGVILSSITALDDCFKEPERTGQFNVRHTIQLIERMVAQGVVPVFISSDVVFDGTRGNYRERDEALPTTKYGEQKRVVEAFLEQQVPGHVIVRLGKLYTLADDDNSPVSGLVRSLSHGETVRAATDQFLTPTLAEEVAGGIVELIQRQARGGYHLTPVEGAVTRLEMATMVADAIGAEKSLILPCSVHDFAFAELRPINCTLNGEKFRDFTGMDLTPFLDVIKSKLD